MDDPQTLKTSRPGSLTPWTLLLVAGVAIVLCAQFLLEAWSETSETAHWVQHALLFWGGVMAGAALLRLYQLGSRAA